MVAGEREGAFRSKVGKDLVQSGLLLAALKGSRPWEVEEAWQDLLSRGKGWALRAQQGLAQFFPEEGFDAWLRLP